MKQIHRTIIPLCIGQKEHLYLMEKFSDFPQHRAMPACQEEGNKKKTPLEITFGCSH